MARIYVTLGGTSAFLSVGLGAFAAHGLRDRLSEAMMEIFRTGVQYQFLHALALIALAALAPGLNSRLVVWSAWFFVGGTVVFSGSLYALALTGIGSFGAITPIGGLFFLAGWLLLILSSLGRDSNRI